MLTLTMLNKFTIYVLFICPFSLAWHSSQHGEDDGPLLGELAQAPRKQREPSHPAHPPTACDSGGSRPSAPPLQPLGPAPSPSAPPLRAGTRVPGRRRRAPQGRAQKHASGCPAPSSPRVSREPVTPAAWVTAVGRRHGLFVGWADPFLFSLVYVPLFWHRPLPGIRDGAEASAGWVRGAADRPPQVRTAEPPLSQRVLRSSWRGARGRLQAGKLRPEERAGVRSPGRAPGTGAWVPGMGGAAAPGSRGPLRRQRFLAQCLKATWGHRSGGRVRPSGLLWGSFGVAFRLGRCVNTYTRSPGRHTRRARPAYGAGLSWAAWWGVFCFVLFYKVKAGQPPSPSFIALLASLRGRSAPWACGWCCTSYKSFWNSCTSQLFLTYTEVSSSA